MEFWRLFNRDNEFFGIAETKNKNFAIDLWWFQDKSFQGKLVVHGDIWFCNVFPVGGASYTVDHSVISMDIPCFSHFSCYLMI